MRASLHAKPPRKLNRVVLASDFASQILLAGLGLKARRDYDPSWWCTHRRARECSVFTIGRALLEKLDYPPDELLRMVRNATIQVAMKWG